MSKKPSVKAIRDSVKRSKRRQLLSSLYEIFPIMLPLQLAHLSRMRAKREAKP